MDNILSHTDDKNIHTEDSSSSGTAATVLEAKPRPYICDVCSKSFSRRYHLNRHTKIHAAHILPDDHLPGKRPLLKELKLKSEPESDGGESRCKVGNRAGLRIRKPREVKHRELKLHIAEILKPCEELLKQSFKQEPLDCSGSSFTEPSSQDEKILGDSVDVHYPFTCVYDCKDCDKRSGRKRCRKRQVENRIYKCDICDKSFTRNYHLNRHKAVHTKKRQFRCKVCDKKFSWRISLKYHMKIHNNGRPFTCEICNKAFADTSNRNRHLRIHANIRPYKCNVCNKNFLEKCRLTQHMKFHLDDKPHKCELCLKSFTEKGPLEIHMRVHTGERPFICDLCGKGFPRKSRLNEHLRLHTGQKPHKCEICQKEFSQKGYLRKHMKFHTGGKPHECDICHRFFSRMDNLNVHRKLHSGEKPYKCTVCSKQFSGARNLKVHEQTHVKECHVCCKRFSSKELFDAHIVSHMELMYSNLVYKNCQGLGSSEYAALEQNIQEGVEFLVCAPSIKSLHGLDS